MDNDKLRNMCLMALARKPSLLDPGCAGNVTVDARYAKHVSWLWKLLPKNYAKGRYRKSATQWELDYIVMTIEAYRIYDEMSYALGYSEPRRTE